jgi:hypothetical protein
VRTSTYQKKNVHINMRPETFNLRVIAERVLYIRDGAPARLSRAVRDVLSNTNNDDG